MVSRPDKTDGDMYVCSRVGFQSVCLVDRACSSRHHQLWQRQGPFLEKAKNLGVFQSLEIGEPNESRRPSLSNHSEIQLVSMFLIVAGLVNFIINHLVAIYELNFGNRHPDPSSCPGAYPLDVVLVLMSHFFKHLKLKKDNKDGPN